MKTAQAAYAKQTENNQEQLSKTFNSLCHEALQKTAKLSRPRE